MRFAPLALLLAGLALPGCFFAPGAHHGLEGPTTAGDRGRTDWQISDGLCGAGLFGSVCDLSTRVALGATPLVQLRARSGTSLTGATLMGGSGVDVTGFRTSTDDDGLLLQAHVGSTNAGSADVIVLDANGTEIDRVHLTFVAVARLSCGELGMAVTRDYSFAGLVSGTPVSVTADGTGNGSTVLACRADDASGNPLLTVNAVRWSVATGGTSMLTVRSDDLLGSTPAVGATSRVSTMGTGSGTIHAMLGTTSTEVMITVQ